MRQFIGLFAAGPVGGPSWASIVPLDCLLGLKKHRLFVFHEIDRRSPPSSSGPPAKRRRERPSAATAAVARSEPRARAGDGSAPARRLGMRPPRARLWPVGSPGAWRWGGRP